MQVVGTLFERKLRERVEEEISRITTILQSGDAVKDYADYRHNTGRIAALKTVLMYCEDVGSDVQRAV